MRASASALAARAGECDRATSIDTLLVSLYVSSIAALPFLPVSLPAVPPARVAISISRQGLRAKFNKRGLTVSRRTPRSTEPPSFTANPFTASSQRLRSQRLLSTSAHSARAQRAPVHSYSQQLYVAPASSSTSCGHQMCAPDDTGGGGASPEVRGGYLQMDARRRYPAIDAGRTCPKMDGLCEYPKTDAWHSTPLLGRFVVAPRPRALCCCAQPPLLIVCT
eukprot:scaffold4158_cov130-Isochrysis_galbana.AAC.2